MSISPIHERRWYQTSVGIVVASIGVAVLTAVIFFVVMTLRYWWQIKHGRAQALEREFAQAFSVGITKPLNNLAVANRGEVESSSSPFVGRPNATTVVVEFVDFKCPNCQAAAPIIDQMIARYGYKTKFIFRHFPIETLHPGATDLSKAVYCMGQQGNFMSVYDYVYRNQDSIPNSLTDEAIQSLARAVSVDPDKATQCYHDPATLQTVNADYFAGIKAGVRGTPTFFVNGEKIEGVIPNSWWEDFFKQSN